MSAVSHLPLPRTPWGTPGFCYPHHKWWVAKSKGFNRWLVMSPEFGGDGSMFATHAEAIAYADRMARSNP